MRTSQVVAATLLLDAVFFGLNLYVFGLTSSRAVLSQSVEAAADLSGSLMILWGQRAALLGPSDKHPFGRGKERFFWAYSAGLITFSLAGTLVFVEGAAQMLTPHLVGDLRTGLLTVAFTFAGSLGSLLIVLAEMRRDRQTVSQLLASSHQGVKTVFLQDVVSLAGSAVSLAGLAAVLWTGAVVFDGLAAAVVGALLFYTGLALAGEGRELLVGVAIRDEEGRAVLQIVERYPFVRHVREMQSMLLGPEDRLVVLRVNFLDEMTTDDIEMHIDQLRRFVCGEHPAITHLIIEPVRAAMEEPTTPAVSPSRAMPEASLAPTAGEPRTRPVSVVRVKRPASAEPSEEQ